MTTRATHKRPALEITRDPDGGITVHDPGSDLVVSIIATSPAANGPHGLHVEVYAYRGGAVLWSDVSRREVDDATPIRVGINRHPTFSFFGANE